MKNALLLFVFMLTIQSLTNAQQMPPRNAAYAEVGGAGLFASANYERQLGKKPGIALRAGLGYYYEKAAYLTIPVGIAYLYELKKRKNFFIEGALTGTYAVQTNKIFSKEKLPDDAQDFYWIPSIGYRKHTSKNLMWRISVAAVIHPNAVTPWAGFCVGKLF